MGIFKGIKLKKARLYRGVTITHLAEKINISKQSISMFENDKAVPSFDTLLALSLELDFPIDFFTNNVRRNYETEVTYFRSQVSASKMKRTSYLTKQEFVVGIYDFLFKYINVPSLNVPDIEFRLIDKYYDNEYEQQLLSEIEDIAQKVRSHWNLGNEPIDNLINVFEKNGIFTNSIQSDEVTVDAFSQRIILYDINESSASDVEQENALIAIMIGSVSESRVLFDLAHELGHIVLHRWSDNLELLDKEEFKLLEKQANMFSSSFLLPADTFGYDVKKYPNNLNYYIELKKKWKVSIQCMIYRTFQLGIINSNQFKYLMSQVSSKGWRKNEPLDTNFIFKNSIFQDAIDILIKENIFTAQSFLTALDKFGFSFNPRELEILLNLRKGTLIVQEENTTNIIELK